MLFVFYPFALSAGCSKHDIKKCQDIKLRKGSCFEVHNLSSSKAFTRTNKTIMAAGALSYTADLDHLPILLIHANTPNVNIALLFPGLPCYSWSHNDTTFLACYMVCGRLDLILTVTYWHWFAVAHIKCSFFTKMLETANYYRHWIFMLLVQWSPNISC